MIPLCKGFISIDIFKGLLAVFVTLLDNQGTILYPICFHLVSLLSFFFIITDIAYSASLLSSRLCQATVPGKIAFRKVKGNGVGAVPCYCFWAVRRNSIKRGWGRVGRDLYWG